MAKYEWVGVDKELEYMATVDWASILDFKDDSMGSWEEEGWDQNLGPIPFDMLIEPTDSKFDFTHTPPTPIGTNPESYRLEDADGSCIHDSDEVPKFQMPSLESELNPLTSKQKRSKRCRPVGISRWSLISPLFKRRRERRNKLPCLSPTSQTSEISICSTNVVSSLSHAKKCSHCGIMKTPQWREGPLGPKTLCNACGVRHRSGRLFPEYRPAASPTFVPSLHSNSHKKVIEMRNKGQNKVEKIEQPKIPPKIEFSYR